MARSGVAACLVSQSDLGESDLPSKKAMTMMVQERMITPERSVSYVSLVHIEGDSDEEEDGDGEASGEASEEEEGKADD